ncbi:MAG TPA: cytochrome c oxidase subunit 3, partial [Ktedonobacterales bacterium]
AYRGVLGGSQLVVRIGLALALLLAVVTLIWQIRFMGQQQFAAKDGSFASTYILLSGYHVYHLSIGVFLGLGLTVRALQGRYTRERHIGIVTIGYFWYWMALMPVLVTLMMALLPPKL